MEADTNAAFSCCDFTNSEKFMAAGSLDKKIRIYDIKSMTLKDIIDFGDGEIKWVSFTANDQYLIAAGKFVVKIYDMKSKKLADAILEQ